MIERMLFCEGKPVPSIVALNNGDFELAGELMVMSILQGGPAPSFLHPSVFAYLADQPLQPQNNDERYKNAAIKV